MNPNLILFLAVWVIGIVAIVVAHKFLRWGIGYAIYVACVLAVYTATVLPDIF